MLLQESVTREIDARTTILALLRERMDGLDGAMARRRRTLKERLGFKGIGCCGPTWGFRPTTISVREEDEDEEPDEFEQNHRDSDPVLRAGQSREPVSGSDLICLSSVPISSGMNLAAALAAERHLRASNEPDGVNSVGPDRTNGGSRSVPGTPLRMSLMRLLEETDFGDGCVGDGGGEVEKKEKEGVALGNDSVCCVCMGRKKGAAFIPCGHTFCRVCSRELWLNRGSCPLCNRSILEILDIF